MRWIQPNELRRVVVRLVKVLGLNMGPWMVLADRLHRLWKLSGTKFLIAYIKECRLALIAWANSSQYTPNPGVRVRIRPNGWPSIVPSALRVPHVGTLAHKVTFRGLHTVFNLYRVMDWKGAVPDFSSITNGFTGVSDTLFPKEVSHAISMFPKVQFPKGITTPWVNTSAGPNHPWSTWSSGKDVFAWALEPYLYIGFLAYAWASGQILVAIWLGVLSHLFLPIALLLRFRGFKLNLGRLAVLAKDGGGKRRIVGVVDFWSQWLLKSLHTYLFDILRRIPQDGTFDQLGPLRSLLDFARLGHPCFSFDLSNATDRLPVALQQQVLSHLVGPLMAWSWRVLLTHRTYYHEKAGGLKYSVGQPMGCLSSWAILAITHHVIVQVAAYRTGYVGWYPFYAVLGDDIVILGQRVAEEYLSIMRYLGVPINLTKSISSEKGLLEFARRVVSAHHGDLSPVSGRQLLRSVRAPIFIADLLVHVLDLGLVDFPNQVREILVRLGPEMNRKALRGTGRMLVARAFVLRRFQGVCRIPSANWQDEWFRSLLGPQIPGGELKFTASILEQLEALRRYEGDLRRAVLNWARFYFTWFRTPLFNGTLGGILSIPLVIVSPAFWTYLLAYVSALLRLYEIGRPLYVDMLSGTLGISIWGNYRRLPELNFNYGGDSDVAPIPIPEMFLEQVRRPSISDILESTQLLAYLHKSSRPHILKRTLRTHMERLPAPKTA